MGGWMQRENRWEKKMVDWQGIVFVDCGNGIDWGEARVAACEYGLQQRKARKGIESRRERSNGKVVLNNYEPLTTWRPTLDRYLDSESKTLA